MHETFAKLGGDLAQNFDCDVSKPRRTGNVNGTLNTWRVSKRRETGVDQGSFDAAVTTSLPGACTFDVAQASVHAQRPGARRYR